MGNWFLKKADGSTFGPVDKNTLRAWAADGRVEPTDQISTNGGLWEPAPEVRNLGMDWTAELPDGKMYGPVHLCALLDLVASGAIHARSPLRHRVSIRITSLAELLTEAGTASDARDEAVRAERLLVEQEKITEDRMRLLEQEVQHERTAADEARARMQAVEDQLREVMKQLRDLNDRYIRLRDQTRGAPRA